MEIEDRAKRIKLLLLDVDGVLTDGRVIIGNYGDEIKRFDIKDGLGVVFMRRCGIKCAIITAQSSKIVKIRAKQLGIEKIYQNHYKIKSLKDIKARFGVKEDEICFIGDDLIDIPILKRIGLAVSVPNAVSETKEVAHYVTKKPGGAGAVREVCEMILKAQGKWEELTKEYFK